MYEYSHLVTIVTRIFTSCYHGNLTLNGLKHCKTVVYAQIYTLLLSIIYTHVRKVTYYARGKF